MTSGPVFNGKQANFENTLYASLIGQLIWSWFESGDKIMVNRNNKTLF